MAREPGTREGVTPEEAFAALGNETRVRILQCLADADDPLPFTDLRDRIGLAQGGQFNYHLDKLRGHFVEETDGGYALRRPGERIIEAVLSGAVTDAPERERTGIDRECQLCGASIEVRYTADRIETFCTECTGMWRGDPAKDPGYLGSKRLPPAGVDGRGPSEMFDVAWTWSVLELFALATDVCPRCAASVDVAPRICEQHESEEDRLCENCGNRYAVKLQFECSTCNLELDGTLPIVALTDTELLAFLTTRGHNPVAPEDPTIVQRVFSQFDEEIRSIDPFEAEITFTIDGEALTLTVNDDLAVVDTRRHPIPTAD